MRGTLVALFWLCVGCSFVAESSAGSCLDAVMGDGKGSKGVSSTCSALSGNAANHDDAMDSLLGELLRLDLEYIQLASQFSRDSVAWPGFHGFIQGMADEHWKEALDLVKHAAMRGLKPKIWVQAKVRGKGGRE
ncbi:unnamed protein product, partial [Darwinula stevensoni]